MPWPRDDAKLDRVRSLMADQGLDAIVARAPDNVVYLTDFWGMKGWTRWSSRARESRRSSASRPPRTTRRGRRGRPTSGSSRGTSRTTRALAQSGPRARGRPRRARRRRRSSWGSAQSLGTQTSDQMLERADALSKDGLRRVPGRRDATPLLSRRVGPDEEKSSASARERDPALPRCPRRGMSRATGDDRAAVVPSGSLRPRRGPSRQPDLVREPLALGFSLGGLDRTPRDRGALHVDGVGARRRGGATPSCRSSARRPSGRGLRPERELEPQGVVLAGERRRELERPHRGGRGSSGRYPSTSRTSDVHAVRAASSAEASRQKSVGSPSRGKTTASQPFMPQKSVR